MGSVVSNIFGTSEGPSTGGVGGVDDLKAGLQDQSNELLTGLGPTREARQQQMQNFTQALYNQATGNAPSLADAQMKRAQDRNLAMQLAAARSNRAVNPALAFRTTQRAGSDANQKSAQDAAILGLQERNQAQNQFANFTGQQQQLSAQARTGALGGAQAAANIDAASAARGDRFLGMGLNGAGSGIAAMLNKGGLVKGYADGGTVTPLQVSMEQLGGPGKILDISHGESYGAPGSDSTTQMGSGFGKYLSKLMQPGGTAMAGGAMDEMGAAGGAGSMMSAAPLMLASHGAVVPGKAPVKGDSVENDVVPAMLSPGEMVIPKSVVKDGHKAVSDFAREILKRDKPKIQKLSKGGMVKPSGFGGVLEAKKYLEQGQAQINSKFKKGC